MFLFLCQVLLHKHTMDLRTQYMVKFFFMSWLNSFAKQTKKEKNTNKDSYIVKILL